MNMMMTMRVSAVTLVVVVACASLVVTSSAFAHNNHEGHGHGHGHEQQHTHASHSTTCDHDKLKNRPGYGRNAPRDHVRYQAHDDYPQHFPASRRDVRTAHVLTVDPNATLGNMRMRAYFDSAACPGPGCGHCVNVGDTVQTFDGSNTVVCAADDIATAAKQAYVMDVLIAGAARFLGDALRINPVSGNLPVSAGNCGSPGTPVPAAHSSGGVANADFAIYVTMAPKTDTTSLTVAWALSCRYDIAGRPTAAHVNFIPRRLNNAGPRDPVATQGDTLTAIHEISHALGFASPFFDGNGYYDLNLVNQPGGTVTVPSAAPFFKARTVINSPRVLREVREYFACPTAVGAEVEDQGGAGTAASHFEKRVFNQDAMAGISSTVAAFPSRVQLAFFEDTGHYVANYSAVASFYATWGRGKGCAFLDEKCDSATNRASGEFCFITDTAAELCTYDGLASGYCGATTFGAPLASNMQYFSNPNVGSTLQIDDFCPAALYYSNRRCVSATSDLTAPNGNGEYLGVDSRCFQSNLVKVASLFGSSASSTSGSGSGNKPAAESGRCFQALCNADGTLSVIVELRELRCPLDGSAGAADTSPLAGFTGAILCPPARRFCPANATAMPVLTARPAAAASSSTGDQVGFRGPVAAACAARAQCASRKLRLLPACREFAFAVTRCFGTDCEEEMVAWLVGAGARGNCSGDGARAAFGRYCEEGRQGVQDVCNLAGAGRLAWAAAAVLLAVLTTMML